MRDNTPVMYFQNNVWSLCTNRHAELLVQLYLLARVGVGREAVRSGWGGENAPLWHATLWWAEEPSIS
jgi:hypothetical protein